MKFVHAADMHLDRPFVNLGGNKEMIKRKKLEQKYVFKKLIDYVKSNNIELLFLSGDIFEQKFITNDTINFLISSFEEIENTKVFISPGNHDPKIKSSPYVTSAWPQNVYIFDGTISKIEVKNINIYGLGFEDYTMDTDIVSTIELDKNAINILVTHGTLDGAGSKYHDIKSAWLKDFDYVALGHIHLKKIDDSKIIYPGSLTARRV